MDLSPYTLRIPYDKDQQLIYSTANGSLVLLDSKHCPGGKIDLTTFSPDEWALLGDLGFHLTTEDVLRQVRDSYSRNSDVLVLIVEATDRCNCACTYCYERGWPERGTISQDSISAIVEYLEKCTRGGQFRVVRTDFMGGEPLLASEQILSIYRAVRKLCQDRGIVYKPGIDTNGTLLRRSFLSEFHYLNMSVTLSTQEDHDRNRPYADGRGSFDTIVGNLIACKDIIDKKAGPTLSVRYNTHSRNYTSLGPFLEKLTSVNVPVSRVEAQYVDEYPQNSFSNGLTRDEFMFWNSTVCFDTLIEHGCRVGFFPATAASPCKAYRPFNCKVFANGYVGLCDASPCVPGLTVIEIAQDPSLVNNHFSQFKSWSPIQDPECASCVELVMCGGKRFCRRGQCNYSNYDLASFLRRYHRYSEAGKGALLPALE